jgi:cell division protein ZapA
MGVQVEIFGQTYSLRADADEAHVRKVADLVDLKMREVANGSHAVSTLQIAVLAAMDLASDMLQQRNGEVGLLEQVEHRTGALLARVEELVSEV